MLQIHHHGPHALQRIDRPRRRRQLQRNHLIRPDALFRDRERQRREPALGARSGGRPDGEHDHAWQGPGDRDAGGAERNGVRRELAAQRFGRACPRRGLQLSQLRQDGDRQPDRRGARADSESRCFLQEVLSARRCRRDCLRPVRRKQGAGHDRGDAGQAAQAGSRFDAALHHGADPGRRARGGSAPRGQHAVGHGRLPYSRGDSSGRRAARGARRDSGRAADGAALQGADRHQEGDTDLLFHEWHARSRLCVGFRGTEDRSVDRRRAPDDTEDCRRSGGQSAHAGRGGPRQGPARQELRVDVRKLTDCCHLAGLRGWQRRLARAFPFPG